MTATIQTARVRFRRPYQAYRTGQVVEVTRGLARTLVLNGRADMADEPQLRMAVAPEPAGLETAVAEPVVPKKRGRPRKAK